MAWQARFGLTLVEDLEDAATAGDIGAACVLVGSFLAATVTLSRFLWPAEGAGSDPAAARRAEELRALLSLGEDSPIAPSRVARFVSAIRYTRRDCVHYLDLRGRTLSVGGEALALEPLIAAVDAVWRRAAEGADRVPRVE